MTVNMGNHVVVEYLFRDMADGEYWIDLKQDSQPHGSIGPFFSEAAREAALQDLTDMTRSLGAVDLPEHPQ